MSLFWEWHFLSHLSKKPFNRHLFSNKISNNPYASRWGIHVLFGGEDAWKRTWRWGRCNWIRDYSFFINNILHVSIDIARNVSTQTVCANDRNARAHKHIRIYTSICAKSDWKFDFVLIPGFLPLFLLNFFLEDRNSLKGSFYLRARIMPANFFVFSFCDSVIDLARLWYTWERSLFDIYFKRSRIRILFKGQLVRAFEGYILRFLGTLNDKS